MMNPQPKLLLEGEDFSLPKAERIHLKRSVDELYKQGKAFLVYPLRVVYLINDAPLEARGQMMVAVGKKYFRRANKRNRVKRLVREAYRQNKHPWLRALKEADLYGRVAYSNVAKEMPTYEQVERAVVKSIKKILTREGLISSIDEVALLPMSED